MSLLCGMGSHRGRGGKGGLVEEEASLLKEKRRMRGVRCEKVEDISLWFQVSLGEGMHKKLGDTVRV